VYKGFKSLEDLGEEEEKKGKSRKRKRDKTRK